MLETVGHLCVARCSCLEAADSNARLAELASPIRAWNVGEFQGFAPRDTSR